MKKICLVTCFAVVLAWALQPAVHAQSSDPQFQELLRKIDGRRYTCHGMTPTCPIADGATMVIDVRESVLVLGIILPDSGYKAWGPNEGHWKIENRKSTYPLPRPRVSLPPGMTSWNILHHQ